MAKLNECQQRILAELDEAWEDNVFSLLNTVWNPKGERSEVSIFVEAIAALIEKDMIVLGWENFYPRNQQVMDKSSSQGLATTLAAICEFKSLAQRWGLRGGDMKKDRYPIVCVTEKGHQWGRGLLNKRGFRWWLKEI